MGLRAPFAFQLRRTFMTRMKTVFVAAMAGAALAALSAHAAETLPTAGALVVVPAFGEVRHANDQAAATLAVEEQDKDKTAAAGRQAQAARADLMASRPDAASDHHQFERLAENGGRRAKHPDLERPAIRPDAGHHQKARRRTHPRHLSKP